MRDKSGCAGCSTRIVPQFWRFGPVQSWPGTRSRQLPTLAQRHRAHRGKEEAGRPERSCSLPKHGMPIPIPTRSIRPHRPFRKTRPGERGHQQPEDVTGLHGLQNQYGIDVRHRSTRSFRSTIATRLTAGSHRTIRQPACVPTTMTMSHYLSVERCRLQARRLSTPSHFVGPSRAADSCRAVSGAIGPSRFKPNTPGRPTPGPTKDTEITLESKQGRPPHRSLAGANYLKIRFRSFASEQHAQARLRSMPHEAVPSAIRHRLVRDRTKAGWTVNPDLSPLNAADLFAGVSRDVSFKAASDGAMLPPRIV